MGVLLIMAYGWATPAAAVGNHGSSGPGRPPPRGPAHGPTENNDHNDNGTPNNVPDAGDNRHPSGNDRSVEHGQSGNQGNTHADPDGAANGGVDQPDGAGGVDLADQDGNNGCGNDDDFEDDNKGRCGRQATEAMAAALGLEVVEPQARGAILLGVADAGADDGAVLDAHVTGASDDPSTATATAAAAPATDPQSAPRSLARTGASIALLTVLGIALIGGGMVLRRPLAGR